MRIYLIITMLLLAAATFALTPKDVLVVANTNSPESIALAKHYLKVRRIPRGNLCRIATATGFHCTRAEYETQIRIPIRDYLIRHKLTEKIHCIALMWGVPVKIGWQPWSSAYPEIERVYDDYGEVALRDLARCEQWAKTVGVEFPVARGDDLTHPELYFTALPNDATIRLPRMEDHASPEAYSERATVVVKAMAGVQALLATKRTDVTKIADAGQRAIAERQLQAITVALRGSTAGISISRETDVVDHARADAIIAALRYESATEARSALDTIRSLTGLVGLANAYATEMNPAAYRDAAVDNELALLWYGRYPLGRMQRNPLFWQPHQPLEVAPKSADGTPAVVYMTARLDAPTAADATRMLDDAIATEKVGLRGTVYLDAGGKYPYYDVHYRNLAAFFAKHTKLNVVLDEKPALFAPNACPDTALYTGWYQLRTYVPAFAWNRGSVGFHLASFEAADLRNPQATDWCVKILQGGAAATLGPVSEPYLGAFPLPEEFFPLLLTGRYALAECFWRTLPNASWQMTLIGDPLYMPFKKNPQVTPEQLPPGLALKS